MRIKIPTVFFGVVGLFTALTGCSDNAAITTPTPAQPQQSTAFNSYEELIANAVCNESVNGVVAYTVLENTNFICTVDAATGAWVWSLVQENIPQTEQAVQSGVEEDPSNPSEGNPCPLNSPMDAFVNSTVVSGTMTDARDGMVYRTVKIGNQEWMAENLKYLCQEHKLPPDPEVKGSFWSTLGGNIGYCDDLYGFFYDSRASNGLNKYCPDGWHIPDVADWNTLLSYAGGKDQYAGAALKSTVCWAEYTKSYDAFGNVVNLIHNGDQETDTFGFTVLPSGMVHETVALHNYHVIFQDHSIGEMSFFWSAGENKFVQCEGICPNGQLYDSEGTYIVKFNLAGPVTIVPYTNSDNKSYAYFSDATAPLANVRCIKD